jgi:hypothetical protein
MEAAMIRPVQALTTAIVILGMGLAALASCSPA